MLLFLDKHNFFWVLIFAKSLYSIDSICFVVDLTLLFFFFQSYLLVFDSGKALDFFIALFIVF